MCIAILNQNKDNIITENQLSNSWDNNNQGAGLLYFDLKFRIKLFQILMKLSEQKRSHLYIFLELNRDSELKRHLSTVYTPEKIKKVSELSLKMWQDYFSPQANQNA